MDRVEILYDLSEYVQMKPQRFGSNLLGVLYNNFSKKGARNLGANSRNPGANYDDVQFFFLSLFSATTEGSGTDHSYICDLAKKAIRSGHKNQSSGRNFLHPSNPPSRERQPPGVSKTRLLGLKKYSFDQADMAICAAAKLVAL